MQKISPLTSSRNAGPYQSVPSSPDTAEKKPPPATTAFTRHLGVVSSSSERVSLDSPRAARHPADRGRGCWKLWLAGIAVLGGTACARGFFLWRSEHAASGLMNTGMRDNRLPYPVALQAVNSTALNIPTALETMPGEAPPASRGLDPYRGHFPTRGHGGLAADLPKKNRKIIRLLKKTGLLDAGRKPTEFSMEEITAAAARYLSLEEPKGKTDIAWQILKNSDFYVENKNPTLSSTQADLAIGHWFFDNILGTSLDMALAISVAKDSYPFMFTLDSIRYLLSPAGLQAEGRVYFNTLPESDQEILKSRWEGVVQKEIPLLAYYGSDPQLKGISLDNIGFASLFSGSLFLYESGINLGETDRHEVMKTGGALWDMALSDGVDADMLKYFSLPALLFQAVNHPEKLFAENKANPFLMRATALNDYLAHRKQVRNALEDLEARVNAYTGAVKRWHTRGQLADNIIEGCPKDTIFPLVSSADAVMTKEQKYRGGKKQAKEKYLNNMQPPCKKAPESIDNEYATQTKDVADRFSEMDKLLIMSTLGAVEKKERDFILSEEAIIHSLKIIPFIKANGILAAMRDNGVAHYEFDNIKGADIFSVTIAGERRCYAMKGKSGHGYDIIRFDQALPQDDDDKTAYSNLHPLIAYSEKDPEKSLIKKIDQKNDRLATFLTNRHRDNFYNTLYNSGYTPSDLQKIWGVVKHIIPFYDCVEGIIENNIDQVIPACLLDAVSFFFVGAKAARISNNFGSSIIEGLSKSALVFAGNTLDKGTLKTAGAQLLHHIRLPAVPEVSSVAKSALKASDPGFDLLAFAANKSLGKIIKHLEKYGGEKHFDEVIAKLKSAELQTILPSSITLDDSKRLLAPLREETAAYMPFNSAGKRQDSQTVKFMFHHNPGLAPQRGGQVNQLINLDHVPNRINFLKPMKHYYAIFYPNKFDHTIDIVNSVQQYYASPQVYLYRYGQNPLTIPPQFFYLRNHINVFINEVNKAHDYAARVKRKFERTTMVLPNGIMQYPQKHPIKTYLSKILETDNEIIIRQAMTRLKYHTVQIVDFFEKSKQSIIFASCTTPAHPYVYRADCPMGFTYPDDVDSRVIILLDNFNTAPILSTQPHLTVLHEVSHHSGSLDFLLSPSTSRVGDASEFMESVDDALHLRGTDFINIDDEFVRAFNRDLGGAALTKQQIGQLLIRDPMLKANAFMDNADFIAKIISDIAENKPFNHDYRALKKKRSAADSPDKIRLNAAISFIYKKAMNRI